MNSIAHFLTFHRLIWGMICKYCAIECIKPRYTIDVEEVMTQKQNKSRATGPSFSEKTNIMHVWRMKLHNSSTLIQQINIWFFINILFKFYASILTTETTKSKLTKEPKWDTCNRSYNNLSDCANFGYHDFLVARNYVE